MARVLNEEQPRRLTLTSPGSTQMLDKQSRAAGQAGWPGLGLQGKKEGATA